MTRVRRMRLSIVRAPEGVRERDDVGVEALVDPVGAERGGRDSRSGRDLRVPACSGSSRRSRGRAGSRCCWRSGCRAASARRETASNGLLVPRMRICRHGPEDTGREPALSPRARGPRRAGSGSARSRPRRTGRRGRRRRSGAASRGSSARRSRSGRRAGSASIGGSTMRATSAGEAIEDRPAGRDRDDRGDLEVADRDPEPARAARRRARPAASASRPTSSAASRSAVAAMSASSGSALPAREADLAAVVAVAGRPLGQDDPGDAVRVRVEQDQDAGRSAGPARRRRRAAAARPRSRRR